MSWEGFKTFFRRHDYNIEHPIVVTNYRARIDGKPVTFKKYRCTKCGNELALSLSEMRHLPLPLSHGCPGENSRAFSSAVRASVS